MEPTTPTWPFRHVWRKLLQKQERERAFVVALVDDLTSAASMGPVRRFDPAIVETARPDWARASASAARPGGSSDPEIIAANVSRM